MYLLYVSGTDASRPGFILSPLPGVCNASIKKSSKTPGEATPSNSGHRRKFYESRWAMASLENVTFWACSADICACSRFQPAMPIQHASKLAWISGVCAVWYSVGRSSASHIDPEAACSKGLWVRPQLSKASQDVSAGLDRAGSFEQESSV